ncbi:NUDIX domain-containing protein [Streptomyces nodosus]|uniref:NUDIX domain-containing protein n=1 Tax=Streptomyces nodosus TaxID=40318 RepID=UPI00382D5BF9
MTSGARAPGHPVTAALLMTDPADRLLIVRPVKAGAAKWHLPGGLVEENESPSDAVRREVREELGLTVTVDERDLAAVEWLQATRAGRRDRLAFLFSGPVLCPEDTERIQLQRVGPCARCRRPTHRYGCGGRPLCQWCMAPVLARYGNTIRYVSTWP